MKIQNNNEFQTNVTIITEGGKQFGFGHLTRCLSIASAFKNHNYRVTFMVNGDESIANVLKNENYKITYWAYEKIQDYNILLIDSMEITDKKLLELEKLNNFVIFIDDEKRRNILNRGIVIDWTVLSDKQNHFQPKKKGITYLLGSKYTPLRAEFTTASRNIIRKNLKKIMLTFGGADVRNLSPNILKTLSKKFPQLEKYIVIGAGFTNVDAIKSFKDKNTHLIYNANTQTMIKLMQDTDLAIASGGQTLYELARIGTPTIAILLVENAKDDTLGWAEVGSVKNIGWYADEMLLEKLTNEVEKLHKYTLRKKMSDKSKKYIPFNGAEFLVDSILEQL